MQKKVEKMFHALHKVDMHACYTKQKVNLACPNKVSSFSTRLDFPGMN